MKKCSKLISLLLAVSMIFSMLPTFAAAENVSVEDVAEISTNVETDTPAAPSEPIEITAAVPVASEPVAVLQDDDANQIAAGNFLKTVGPDGTPQYFNTFSAAMAVANGWTTGGGVVYLLTDYTAINSEESSAWLIPGNNPSYTSTDEDGLEVYGYWIDLGGHTLTARVAQVLFGGAGACSVNIRNGRVIHQNYGRGSGQIGVVTYGYSSTSPVSGGKVLTARTTLKNAEILSMRTLKNSSVNCVTSMIGNNEVNVYDSKLIAATVAPVKFQKSSAVATGDGLIAMQNEGLHCNVNLYGKSVVGSLSTERTAVLYTKTSGSYTGIKHTVTINAEQESIFLGSDIFLTDSSIPLTVSTPKAMMTSGTYSYALPNEDTFAAESTVGAKPTDLESVEYKSFKYPPAKTDEEMIAEGSFIKTVAPSGITIGYSSLSDAFIAAGSWTTPGGKVTLLQDYTLIYSSLNSALGVLSAPTEAYINEEDPDLTVEGIWFDLGGHTLTVTAGRALIYSGASPRINIKNGNIIYRNSGRTDPYYGAISIGIASPTLVASGKVNNAVVNLKDVNFYTLHWSGAGTNVNRVAPVFCTTLWKAELNLYNSTMISEDAQAIEFNKASNTPTGENKDAMLAQGVGYSVNLHGTSVIGSLANYSAITLSDIGKTDSGVPFDVKVVMSENARVLGTDLITGSINSKLNDSFTTENGTALTLGQTTYDLTLPNGATIASTSTGGAKPEYLETATKSALIYTPLDENDGVASYITESGSEGTATTLAKAFAAWKKAGYKGSIKLYADPEKDDITGASIEVGGNYSFATTTTTKQRMKADVVLTSAANGGNLTLDLNGHTISTADIFLAAEAELNEFSLNIQNGKIESASDAALILDGAKFGVTLENAELAVTSSKGYCIYDYRIDHSYLFATGCKMTAQQGKAIYVLTNDANKNDTSLLYYIKDLVYTDAASTTAPIGQGTNVSGSVQRKRTVIFDGDSDAYGTSMKSYLTTEDAAAAVLTFNGKTFNFAQAADAITYAAYFGRCFTDVTVTMKQDVVLAATKTVDNTGFTSAFELEFDSHAFTGNGTNALLALTGTTDITVRNAAITSGVASVLTGANSYTFENCSINSKHVFARVSSSASENDVATYTAAVTGEEVYFIAAVDAIVYSQCDTNATASAGGTVKLLADSAASASVNYNADDVCVIRLDGKAKALNVDLNGYSFKIPGALCIGGEEAFTQAVSVTISNGTWEQTKSGASAFRVDGTSPLFNLQLTDVTVISEGSGISYFAADSADNKIVITGSTIVARNNGIETLNGEMTGRVGGSVLITDSAIAAVNRQAGYAIVDGVDSANDASHILLVGGDIALYSAMSGSKPVKVSSEDGNICVVPQYKVVLREERAQLFVGDAIKEATNVSETLGGSEYTALTCWTPNTIAYYVTKDDKLTSYSTTEELLAAYQADTAGDGTMTILANVTFPATIEIDKNLTIELSGKTISVTDADAIRVVAGKTLNIQNGFVKSGAIAVVNEGNLTTTNVKLIGNSALKIAGETAATAQLNESALYALDAAGVALDAAGAEGSAVMIENTIIAAPYADVALQIAAGNSVEFLSDPEIYAKANSTAKGFAVDENGTMVVPGNLLVTMLSAKTTLDYPEANGLTYSVSHFGFAMIDVTFYQEGTRLYSETIYSGTASTYDELPTKVSFNNSTFVFAGWKIEGDDTLYQINNLPILFENTTFNAVFEETQNIATVTLNDEVSFYNDLTSAMAAVTTDAELKIWRDMPLEATLTITKGDFTFDLGGNKIIADNAITAVILKGNNVKLKNGTIVSAGNAMEIIGATGANLIDMKLNADAIALSVNGGETQIGTSTLVATNEALYVDGGAEVNASSAEFYSTNSYALTANGTGTMLKLGGSNKVGSALNGQVMLRVTNGATIDTVNDIFYVTRALRESGVWYECDTTSEFVVQSVFPSRNATYVKIANEAAGYSQSTEFYAVTSESSAATVNGVSYNTFAAALSAAGKLEGATVTLLRDIDAAVDSTATYSFTKNMTIDLNGHVLISHAGRQSFSISSGREITFKNGTIIAPSTGSYNFMSSTGSTLTFENVNYFARYHNVYASTSTVGFTVNFIGGVMVNYGSNYVIRYNFDGSGHSGFVTVNDGTVFISGGNRAILSKRNSATEFIMNIQDAYTYGAAETAHFAAVPEKYTNPDLIPGDEEEEDILITNVIPEPAVLEEAANPQAFLNQKFADLTVKYAQYLPNFSTIPTSSMLLHHINQDGVAEFDNVSYGSVADALAAAGRSEEGSATVTLLKDSVESGISTIAAHVTLDLNGKNLSFSGSADMTVNGNIALNGGKLESNGNVLFKAGAKDLDGNTVTEDFRLDQRLMPTMISLTLNDGIAVNYKMQRSALDSFAKVQINGVNATKNDTRTNSVFSRTFDFDSFTADIELTAIDTAGTLHRSGYKTSVKSFADAVAADQTSAANFRTAMSALSQFGTALSATHDWTKAKDLATTGGAVFVDPNKAFDLKFTGGTAGAKIKVTYTDSTDNKSRSEELTFSDAGEVVFSGLFTACLNDTVTVAYDGRTESFTYADMVKSAIGETTLYTAMIAYSNAANALFKN